MTEPSPAPWRARADPWPFVLACVAVGVAGLQPLSNPDTFGHLAQGRVIAEAGWPPALDPFSFWRATPQPWVNYEWLSDWITWDVYALGGPDVVVALAVGMLVLAAGLVVGLGGRLAGSSGAWITSLAVVLAIPASRGRMSARPHLVALVLGALYLVVLTRPEASRRGLRAAAPTLAALGALHLAWVNLHGSHLLGAGLVVCALLASWPVREARRPRLAAIGVVIVASCISPWGPTIGLDAVLHVFDGRYRAAITEWHSVLGDPSWLVAAYSCALLAVGLVLAWRAIRGGPDRALLALVAVGLGVMTIRSGRFTLEMLMLGAPFLGVELAQRPRLDAIVRPVVRVGSAAVVCVLAVLGSASATPDLPIGAGEDLRRLPDAAAHYVEATLPGARVLGSMPTSWYLMLEAPHCRVLYDGRLPFYGPEHATLVTAAIGEPGALMPVVRRFGVDTVVVQHTAPPEAAAMTELAHGRAFVRAWIDASYAVYVRRGTPMERRVDATRFDALPGYYDPGALLSLEDAALPDVREDLGHLGDDPAGRAFGAFVRAMLRVRPLAREGGWAGFRAPADDDERDRLALARRELDVARRQTGPIPVLDAQAGLLATLACDLDAADRAFGAARTDTESRETLFGAAELALRRGDVETVRTFVEGASRMPGGEGDAWVAALRGESDAGVRCDRPSP